MAIEGLPPQFIAWLFDPAQEPLRREIDPSGLDLGHIQTLSSDTVPHPLDLSTFAALGRVLDRLPPGHDFYVPVDAAVRQFQEAFFGDVQGLEAQPLVRFHGTRPLPPDIVVAPGQRLHHAQVTLYPGWEENYFWGFADEISRPIHFWHDRPQGTLVALGATQGLELVNPRTQFLLRIDLDPRLATQNSLFEALFLVAETSDEFRGYFAGLASHPQAYDILRSHVAQAVSEGKLPTENLMRFDAFRQRTDGLGFQALQRAYQDDFNPRHQRRYVHNWLNDEAQYETIRDMYRRGAVAFIQADVFDPNDWSLIGDFLRGSHPPVDTLALSDPIDFAGGEMQDPQHGYKAGEDLVRLREGLRHLPWNTEARLQWTSVGGIPVLRHDKRGNILSPQRAYADASGTEFSGPVQPYYGYVQIPIHLFHQWLTTVQPTHSPMEQYFGTLDTMIQEGGVFIDGQLYILPAAPKAAAPRLFSQPSRLAYYIRKGWEVRAQRLLARMVREAKRHELTESCQISCRQVDRQLDPYERGTFRLLLAHAEHEEKAQIFPDDGGFDPRPHRLRQVRNVSRRPSFDQRFEDLHTRRREDRFALTRRA